MVHPNQRFSYQKREIKLMDSFIKGENILIIKVLSKAVIRSSINLRIMINLVKNRDVDSNKEIIIMKSIKIFKIANPVNQFQSNERGLTITRKSSMVPCFRA